MIAVFTKDLFVIEAIEIMQVLELKVFLVLIQFIRNQACEIVIV